jgi:inorganic pyrophosphatase
MRPQDFMSVGPRAAGSSLVNVVVETPAGSRNKFKFDEKLGLFLLHKILPVGAAFPFDFGFVPGTRAEDGDPLDVMVVGGEPTFTGCLVTVRLLGVIEARQKEKGTTIRNDRLIGTPETAKIRPVGRSLSDLPARLIDQIEHFFVAYNRFEGREFEPLRRRGPKVAEARIEQALADDRKPSRSVETRNHGGATARGRIGTQERSTHRAARSNEGS